MPTKNPNQELLGAFADPDAVARYADGPLRFVPGFADLQRMAGLLIEEIAPARPEILVLGAGGGLELKAFALSHHNWTFVGVDPSIEMLRLAANTLGHYESRVQLVHGYIEDAPNRQFDAATCLLTLHFLDKQERIRTVREVRSRLKPGSPFVVAHMSFSNAMGDRARWFSRYEAFALASGAEAQHVESMRQKVEAHLHVLSPEEDVQVLEQAGFKNVTEFYTAFTWRGWVSYA